MSRGRDPADLSPRAAWERYLNRRRPEASEKSLDTYYYRIKMFVQWCEREGIERVGDLSGWDFDEYESARAQELNNLSLSKQMGTVKNFVEFLERLEAVDRGLAESVHVPTVDSYEESSDVQLTPEDALPLLYYLRRGEFGSRRHAMLELLWHVGCRLSGFRALDVQDFDAEARVLEFRHRPDTGTGLKNDQKSERDVALPDVVSRAISSYLEGEHWDKRDGHGRHPLFTSRQGRPGDNTVRTACYHVTRPCLHTACPHDRDPEDCEWTYRDYSSECPSTRAPHHIRTGSITWQLDRGIPIDVVAKRVDDLPKTIRKHYDKAERRREMEQRRREHVDSKLDTSSEQFDHE